MNDFAAEQPAADEPRLSLTAQFAIMATIVLVLGMGSVGYWVGERIATDVTRNTAVATAFYVDSVIAPLTEDMSGIGVFDEGPKLALSEALAGALGGRIESFKIWAPDGTVVYATDEALVGRKFPMKADLRQALDGYVNGELDSLDDDENEAERLARKPLLEIYSPIRQPWSGTVIGAAEFYEDASGLVRDIRAARTESWLVVGTATLAMLALLYTIVQRGGLTIKQQRAALRQKVAQLSTLLEQNEGLRRRLELASHRNATLAERSLRRLSADLHDGPGQLLAFALLRLDAATATIPPSEDIRSVRDALNEAMREVRNLSRGAALPELDRLDAEQVLRQVVQAHEARSGTTVALEVRPPLPALEQAERIALYRFVQEALNNATRHGGGVAQAVAAEVAEDELVVRVSDRGGGFDPAARTNGLGLAGLEERLVALGGRFELSSGIGKGTVVTMRLPVARQTEAAA